MLTVVRHTHAQARTEFDKLSADQQAEFFAIVEEVKSQRQLTKKQKQANRWSTKEEKNESNDHLRSLRKKVSEVKVRLAKAGDKKVKGQNAKYKFSNKQRALLNASGFRLITNTGRRECP